LFLIFLLS